MKLNFLIFLTLLFASFAHGQFLENVEYGAGYHGNNFINPGFEVLAEKPLIDTRGTGERYSAFGESIVTMQGSVVSYWDPFSHLGLINYYTLNFKQYFGKRLGVQFGGGFLFQSNITTDNFVVDENYNVEKRALQFNNYTGINLSAATFLDNKTNTRSWISKISLSILTPYNSSSIPVFNYHLIYIFKK